jgi:predicted glutamine amidotransferase
MCLIAYNPNGKILDKDRLHTAFKNNRDGAGFMWREQDGRIETTRGFMDFDEVWMWVETLKDTAYSLHFRFRTRGARTEEQCHPFEILNNEKDGMDLVMMHNGTFSVKSFSNDERSDTQIFADILHNELRDWSDPSDIFLAPVVDRMERAIGGGNKLVFMGSKGKDVILNEEAGFWDHGIWFSNRYSFAR